LVAVRAAVDALRSELLDTTARSGCHAYCGDAAWLMGHVPAVALRLLDAVLGSAVSLSDNVFGPELLGCAWGLVRRRGSGGDGRDGG